MEFFVKSIASLSYQTPPICYVSMKRATHGIYADGEEYPILLYSSHEYAVEAKDAIIQQIYPYLHQKGILKLIHQGTTQTNSIQHPYNSFEKGDDNKALKLELLQTCAKVAQAWDVRLQFNLVKSCALHGLAFYNQLYNDSLCHPNDKSPCCKTTNEDNDGEPKAKDIKLSLHFILAKSYVHLDQLSKAKMQLSLASKLLESKQTHGHRTISPSSSPSIYHFSSQYFNIVAKISMKENDYNMAIKAISRHLYFASLAFGPESIKLVDGYLTLGQLLEMQINKSEINNDFHFDKSKACYDTVLSIWKKKLDKDRHKLNIDEIRDGVNVFQRMISEIESYDNIDDCKKMMNDLIEKLEENIEKVKMDMNSIKL